jgi:hypothetical protein
VGNRAISGLIQAKLNVGPVGDRYEQEADRVADQVMRTSAPGNVPPVQRYPEEEEEVQMKPLASTITPVVQRYPEEEEEVQMKPLTSTTSPVVQRYPEEEEEIQMKPQAVSSVIQRKPGGGFQAGEDVERKLRLLRGSGNPLPASLRTEMEARFGVDFDAVRVHADGQADQLNQNLRARAFTHGTDIYLGSNEPDFDTGEGKRLLAHELTHVVQQTGGGEKAHHEAKSVQRISLNPLDWFRKKKTPQQREQEHFQAYAQHLKANPGVLSEKEQALAPLLGLNVDQSKMQSSLYNPESLKKRVKREGFEFGAKDWERGQDMETALTRNVKGTYRTMFGQEDTQTPYNFNTAQNEQEKQQRGIFHRLMVATAYGNHQYRHRSGEHKKAEKKFGESSSWSKTALPMGSILTGGGRSQVEFGKGTEQKPGEGIRWLMHGSKGPNPMDEQKVGNIPLNRDAGMFQRTSSHGISEKGGRLHETKVGMSKEGLLPNFQTVGMNLTPTGSGTLLPTTGRFNVKKGQRMGHGGRFEEAKTTSFYKDMHDPGAMAKIMHGLGYLATPFVGLYKGIKAPFSALGRAITGNKSQPSPKTGFFSGAQNYGGQQGHMLFTSKSQKGQSNVNTAIESNAPDTQNLTGHLHDMRARSESEGVFGQSKFKLMSKHGVINPEQSKLIPEGTDSMRSRIRTGEDWKHVQDVSSTLESVKTRQQKKLYQQVLPSTPSKARDIYENRYQQIVKSRKGQTTGLGDVNDETLEAVSGLFGNQEAEEKEKEGEEL